jgi:hypothetical protein
METVLNCDFWHESLVAFTAIMFGVTVLLVVLSVSSHRGSLSSLLVLVGGFCWSRMAGCLHAFVSHTQSWILWGLMGLKHLASLHIIHYGHWVVLATIGRAVGYVASSRLCFISVLLVGWLGEPRGLYPACAKYHYKAQMEPCSSVHSFSCHEICHPVHEVNCGISCVCTVGLRGFHHQEESTLASLCWSTEKTLDSSSLSVDRGVVMACRVYYW